ncbi:MAG: hypothetical protein CMO29_24045 [Tistrella sp.]|nr:AMP-binding protein [uncultured Tistrella sp.]MAM76868.1 hypothetical protein [Tistrella sp.]
MACPPVETAPHHGDILADRIEKALAGRADLPSIAFTGTGGTITGRTGDELRAAIWMQVDRLRSWMRGGTGVLVLAFPAGETFVTLFLGCLMAGITAVPVALPRRGSRSGQFRHIVTDCGAAAVLCAPESRATITAALRGADAGGADPGGRDPRGGAPQIPVIAWPPDGAALPSLPDIDRADAEKMRPAIIQYTSGSTRWPKGVRIMPWNVVENCALVMRAWGMDETAHFVNWLPHYHDMGLMGGILYPLLCGGQSVQMSPFEVIRRPAAWLEAISAAGATFSGGPAFMFADCLTRIRDDEIDGLDLSRWQRAFCGAEPVPAGLLDRFHARFVATGLRRDAVFACYGLAEATLFAAGVPKDDAGTAISDQSVTPCHLTDETRAHLRIVDPAGTRVLAEGETGEICLSGPWIADGYLGRADETAASFQAPAPAAPDPVWLRTGDLGHVTGNTLHVVGRLKDVLICNGRKISAAELEWLAAGIDPALNPLAAAAFAPDVTSSGLAVLAIEPRLGCRLAPDTAALARRIARAVAGEWGIRLTDVVFVPRGRLPRTSSGKIRRAAVARAWRETRSSIQGEVVEVS